MARVRFTLTVEDRVLTTSTSETLLQLLAASNHRLAIERIVISGKSNSGGDTPVHFQGLLQTTAGTASSLTPAKINGGDDETLQVTAQKTFTAEPTDSTVKFARNVHPQSTCELVFPLGRELIVKGGERFAIKAITPTQASTFTVTVEGEE